MEETFSFTFTISCEDNMTAWVTLPKSTLAYATSSIQLLTSFSTLNEFITQSHRPRKVLIQKFITLGLQTWLSS